MKSPIKAVPAGGRLNLFFVEMIIVLLFFGIASAVILNAFAASDRLSRESGRLERMSFCAQSLAEAYSESGDLSQTVNEVFGYGAAEIIGLNSETGTQLPKPFMLLGENCEFSPRSSKILLTLSETEERFDGGTLKTLYIKFENNGNNDSDEDELYSMTSGAYVPDERRADANE